MRGLKACCIWAAALALPLAFLPGCKKEAVPETVVTVQAEHPEQGPIAEHITADAVLSPIAQAAIEPKISAPVKKFYVQRGSRVKAGQLLAVLENKDLAAAALDNEGAYEAAQAAYATATRAQVPEATQQAELAVTQAKANLDLNRDIVASRTKLFAEGAIPGLDLDTAKAALVQAQSAYETAEKRLQAERSVSRAAALKAAQGQLTSAQGKYEVARAQVAFSKIRSPIAGVVTERPLFAGETASAGAPLVTVMDTSTLLAKAHIGQNLAQQLKVGDAASVNVPGVEKPVAAKVSLISPALDPGSTTVEVWLSIDNRNGRLKVGTPVKVSITGQTVARTWKAPTFAILTAQDGSTSVMVVGSDGAAHRKAVTVGIVDGKEAQVTSGLAPTDLVITGGAYVLDEGTKVNVGPAANNDQAPEAGKAAAAAKGGGDN
ncbi:MAG: efflux RND transporter periplasmic adaptor subunit [Acidobacteriota bacterium]|nr:efflux RND transporter periplasmic adaptor subunit [Acidobacteriota bacterium]